MENPNQPQNPETELKQTPPVIEKRAKKHGIIYEIIQFVVIAVLVVVPFRIFIAQPFFVNGESMDPTFKDGEYLIVDQLSYRLTEPKRDSVLIFKYPNDTSKYFIKRVIGLPGETIGIKEGKVTIKNSENPEGFSPSEPSITHPKNDTMNEITLSNDEYFVMGDNRFGSLDSRFWGPLESKYIIGRPILRLLPISRAELLPGDLSSSSSSNK